MAAINSARGPKRMISGPVYRSDVAPITIVAGRNARPTSNAS